MSQQTQIERIGLMPGSSSSGGGPSRRAGRRWDPRPAPGLGRVGYNRRALALREAARTIVREHGGRVPGTVPELERLPGVGPYTARAVAASAFGVPVAPLDVNVRRVVGRVLGGTVPSGRLQDAADGLVSRDDPRVVGRRCHGPRGHRVHCSRTALCGMPIGGDVPLGRVDRTGRPLPDGPHDPVDPATGRRRHAVQADQPLAARSPARAVRDAPAGSWVDAPDGLGEHDRAAVLAALRGLERDGFVEFRDGRARLASDRS